MKLTAKLIFAILFACGLIRGTNSNDIHSTLQRARRVKRVTGGTPTIAGEWPWLVHVVGKIPTKFIFFGLIPIGYVHVNCGGTIVSRRWVVTAAHCFTPTSRSIPRRRSQTAKYWHIRAGVTDNSPSFLDRVKSAVGYKKIYNIHASDIIIYPRYNEQRNWLHDIALIRLEDLLPTDEPTIKPVQLPTASMANWPPDGAKCVAKGWGCTARGRGVVEHARIAVLPKIPDINCTATFGNIDMSSRLCAGYINQGISICPGDSGGPLVCHYNQEWYFAGVASFITAAVDSHNYPAVFTKVPYHMHWINSRIHQRG